MKNSGFSMYMDTIRNVENYRNSTFVIKISEDVLTKKSSKTAFVESISLFLHAGIRVVVMHDGYKSAWSLMDKMGYECNFNGKYRIIDRDEVDIIEMAVSGTINKKLTSVLSEFGIKALGLSGRDSLLIKARKRCIVEDGKCVDSGFIGEIDKINKKLVMDLLNIGCIPVISPIACDSDGNTYILEPNYAAQKISSVLMAEKLIVINGDTENINNSFFEKSYCDKDYEEDVDCIYSSGIIRKPETITPENEIKSVYNIDIDNIDNMIREIFSEKKKNIS